jgi:hypothetical protein
MRLYRDLDLQGAALASTASYLRRERAGMHVGQFISEFYISINPEDSIELLTLETTHAVLRCAVNVKELALLEQSSSIILSLATIVSARTLTKLRINLEDEGMDGLAYINEFKGLQKLNIYGTTLNASSKLYGWTLPSLKRLVWVTHRDDNLLYMEFLSLCSLPSIQYLSLYTKIMPCPRLEDVFTGLIKSKPTIRSLELSLAAPQLHQLLFPHINPSFLSLFQPNPAAIHPLPSTVEELQLVCTSQDEMEGILSTLNELLQTRKALKVVRFNDPTKRFVWFSDDEDEIVDFEGVSRAELVGQASLYLQKGLRILDSRDKTVGDYVI